PVTRNRHPVFSGLDILHRELAGSIRRGAVVERRRVRARRDIGTVHHDRGLLDGRARGGIGDSAFQGAEVLGPGGWLLRGGSVWARGAGGQRGYSNLCCHGQGHQKENGGKVHHSLRVLRLDERRREKVNESSFSRLPS